MVHPCFTCLLSSAILKVATYPLAPFENSQYALWRHLESLSMLSSISVLSGRFINKYQSVLLVARSWNEVDIHSFYKNVQFYVVFD